MTSLENRLAAFLQNDLVLQKRRDKRVAYMLNQPLVEQLAFVIESDEPVNIGFICNLLAEGALPAELHDLVCRTLRERAVARRIAFEQACFIPFLESTSLEIFDYGRPSLPEDLRPLSRLRSLRLRGGRLEGLSAALADLTQLASLGVWDHRIRAIDPRICELTSLNALYLSNNALTDLPDELASLVNLTGLWFKDNALERVPDALFAMTALGTLDLHHNRLTEIPDGIGRLTQLRQLTLSANPIKKISPAIAELEQLEALTLEDSWQLNLLPKRLLERVSSSYVCGFDGYFEIRFR